MFSPVDLTTRLARGPKTMMPLPLLPGATYSTSCVASSEIPPTG